MTRELFRSRDRYEIDANDAVERRKDLLTRELIRFGTRTFSQLSVKMQSQRWESQV
jgi:hypothetical protein